MKLVVAARVETIWDPLYPALLREVCFEIPEVGATLPPPSPITFEITNSTHAYERRTH